MRDKVYRFKEGEKRCRVCGGPMPALTYAQTRKAFVCSKEECRKAFYGHSPRWRQIGANEIKCEAPGCPNYLPAGWHFARRKRFFCSYACIMRFYQRRRAPNTRCALPSCRVPIMRLKKKGYRKRFCSIKHAALYRAQQHNRKKAGKYFGRLLEDFTENFVRIHYRPRTVGSIRSHLLRFFAFLRERKIRSLRQITPRTITAFRVWESENCRGGGPRRDSAVKYISVLMAWQIHQGYIKGPNPVIPRIHGTRRERRLPRPYSQEADRTMWRILEKRGDALSRAAVAIGAETGLRISETANLRLPDIDQKSQTIFVRLPNKTSTERRIPYHEKTRRYLEEWLKVRDSSCSHDFLFHNSLKKPLASSALWKHLRMIFDGYLTKRREKYDEVFDGFQYHRLRHSMASNLANHGVDMAVLMAMGGWKELRWDERLYRVEARDRGGRLPGCHERGPPGGSGGTSPRGLARRICPQESTRYGKPQSLNALGRITSKSF
ncbi:MAG: site-specific integrase [Acidobacteria bacterium]|nr:site-specific integrase [Acidobacteriota bacterium]